MLWRILIGLMITVLAACVPHQGSVGHSVVKKNTKSEADGTAAQREPAFQQIINKKPDAFLYMAGRAAIADGNIPLAVNFFSVLARRSQAAAPRMELARLYMQMNRPDQAEVLLQPLLSADKQTTLADDDQVELQQLYAASLHQQGKTSQALSLLEALLQAQPEQVSVRVQMARMLMQQGKMAEAARLAEAGLQQQEDVALLQIMIDLAMQQDAPQRALKFMLRLRTLQPDNGHAAILHAVLLSRLGKAAEAESMLRGFIQEHPAAIGVANHLGRMLIAQQRLNEAVALYRSLLKHGEAMSKIYSMLGMLYYEQKRFSEATDAFREALRLEPENDEFRFYLAINLDMLNRVDEALPLYEAVKAESERYAASQLRRAAISMQREDLTSAEQILLALLKKQPEAGDAWGMLSAVYLQREAYRLLLKRTEGGLKLKKIPRALLINRAIAFDHFKEYPQLEHSIQLLLQQYPDDPEALNFIAYSLAERGVRLDEAEGYVKKALSMRPDNGFYLDSLAWVYYQRGDYVQAETIQRRALGKLDDADPVMYDHLGDMLWQQGKHEEARRLWQQALSKVQSMAADTPNIGETDAQTLRKKIASGL